MNYLCDTNKLGLGTAQFGLDYGISNIIGKNTHDEITEILKHAANLGLQLLDTSPDYGNSEDALGKCITKTTKFKIITKTPVFGNGNITQKSVDYLIECFMQSLKNLKCKKLYGLLIHEANNLLVKDGMLLVKAMEGLKDKGLIDKIGVSVYSPSQIDALLDMFKPDIVQLPLNVFDQRLIKSGHFMKLKKYNIEIHVRSVFLQGLLLMEKNNVPSWFNPIKHQIDDYFNYLTESNISPLVAALSFVRNIKEIDYVLVGVNSVQHLIDVVQAYKNGIDEDFSRFAIYDEKYVNPTLWKM